MRSTVCILGLAIAGIVSPQHLVGQLPGSSTRAVGMGRAYTAAALGYEAIRWNPALLAMPGQPGFSLNVVQGSLDFGSNTFSLGDYQKYSGETLSDADKTEILARVREGGVDRPLTVQLGAGVSTLSMTKGSFGISLGVLGEATSAITADAVELGLFGNVTRTQPGETYDATGSSFGGWGAASVALAYARGISTPVGALAIGGTLKIVRGLGVGYGEALQTQIRNAPTFLASAGGHALVSDNATSVSGGSGFGLDLGGAYQLPSGLRLGLVLENFVSTMSWSNDGLVYYNKQFLVGELGDRVIDSTIVDIDRAPFDASDPAQTALRDSISKIGNSPKMVRAGLLYDLPKITVTADAFVRVTKGIDFGDSQRVSAGAEWRPAAPVALRFGLATSFENTLGIHGGFGLKLGPIHLDAAVSNTSNGDRRGFLLAAGISAIR